MSGGECYDFPIKLLQELNPASLRLLLTSGSAHDKKIALFALRMDLLRQHQNHSQGIRDQLPALAALNLLVSGLGDRQLAKTADDALLPFQPIEDPLVAELEAAKKASNRVKGGRTPSRESHVVSPTSLKSLRETRQLLWSDRL
jgi:hypothetical protein